MSNIDQYGLEAKLKCQNTEEYKAAKEMILKSACVKESQDRSPGDAWLISSLTEEEMYNFFTCSSHPIASQIFKVDAECPEHFIKTDSNTIDGHVVNTCLGLDYLTTGTTGEYLGTYSCAFDAAWFGCSPESCINV